MFGDTKYLEEDGEERGLSATTSC